MKQYRLSTKRKGWFYHNVQWVDVNNDGLLDLLAARAYKPMLGHSAGQMTVLTNPGGLLEAWNETALFDGPDVNWLFEGECCACFVCSCSVFRIVLF